MTLQTGTQLGPYRIEKLLGAGGMGEVYQAADTRLQRSVAIKILPPHFANRPDARSRFEREAQVISSLNHPHICTLHDIGRQGDIDYLVMELVEGETLADRLKRSRLPVNQAISYATQIADALDKAHSKGVTHRDLKPSNVMITNSGVKLLDFGLAKLRAPEAAPVSVSVTAVPTDPNQLTAQGTVVGTLQYMAPEVLLGSEADARTDIFALGVVLYEMLTGRKAFDGKTQLSITAAILESEPSPVSDHISCHPLIGDVLRRCLAKDPEQRWQNCRDAGAVLLLAAGQREAAPPRQSRAKFVALGLAAASVVLVIVVGAMVAMRPRPPDAPPQVAFTIEPPDNVSRTGAFAVSPDGRHIAFLGLTNLSRVRIWIRSVETMNLRSLEGTETTDINAPLFWSADSRWIAFRYRDLLQKIDVNGGPVQTVARVGSFLSGTWNNDGIILYDLQAGIERVAAAGGEPVPVSGLLPEKAAPRFPFFLPDGKRFLYFADRAIWVGSLDGDQPRQLTTSESKGVYAHPGFLVFMRQDTLMAAAFDAQTATIKGDPFTIADNIPNAGRGGAFSVDSAGTLLYRSGGQEATSELVWVDRTGKRLGAIGTRGRFSNPEISPEGDRVLVDVGSNSSSSSDIWVFNTLTGVGSQLTFDASFDTAAIWSPDGKRILFAANRQGAKLIQKNSDGSGDEEIVSDIPGSSPWPGSWSRDGKHIVYRNIRDGGNRDIWYLTTSGDRKPIPYLRTEFAESRPELSPNGRWLAYVSDESGVNEIYVQSFPQPGSKWRVSNLDSPGGTASVGAALIRWRADGKELFFVRGDQMLMAVAVETDPVFKHGAPRPLFHANISTTPRSSYAVSPDGRRFLVNLLGEQPDTPITVILNWASNLKR